MGAAYSVSSLFGYFLIMIILLALAIILAKGKLGWILYAVGAVLQLVSLIGRQKTFAMFGMGHMLAAYWIVYFILLAVGAIAIYIRSTKS